MDSITRAQAHQDRLQLLTEQMSQLSQNLTTESLRELHSLAGEMQNIACCHYVRYLDPGVLVVDGDDFVANPSHYCNMAEERTVRVVRDGGLKISICSFNPLEDPNAWCPVCKSTPSMDEYDA